MHSNNYTPLHFGKRSHLFQSLILKHFEPYLLALLALTGILGSVYLLGHNLTQNMDGNKLPEQSSVASLLNISENESEASGDFDKFVKMNGKAKAGEVIEISFLEDETASRYVMEMGNGERLIVTQKNLIYTYDLPGKYVIELKEIRRGILKLVGTKRIKIK
ncbi:MAG: hypothetical protein IPM42_00695 [Saprospiraceae bacterium]|nr:hypothetical protein [Saprospiraceae bacterium]